MAGPITFDDARAIVSALVGVRWEGPGTFDVAAWGWGDDDDWNVVAGALEADTNPDAATLDDTVYLVSRHDGSLRREHYLDVADKLDKMSPVGEHPPDD